MFKSDTYTIVNNQGTIILSTNMEFYLNFIVLFGCLLCVQIQRTYTCKYYEKECGSTCCSASEHCKKNQGKCVKNSSRVRCSGDLSYCYKPTTCCGTKSCCPENSKCCPDVGTCCPADSTCCGRLLCCDKGFTCKGTVCEKRDPSGASESFKWYYLLIVMPLLFIFSLCAFLCRKRSKMAQEADQLEPPMRNAVMSMSHMPATDVTIDVTKKLSGTLPVWEPPVYGVREPPAYGVQEPPRCGYVKKKNKRVRF